MFSDEELERAVRLLSDPDRFAGAERLLAAAAPQLQRILAEALNEGGWFGDAHDAQVRAAATPEDPHERMAQIETLLAEETRMGMWVGVAVGWQLAQELNDDTAPGRD